MKKMNIAAAILLCCACFVYAQPGDQGLSHHMYEAQSKGGEYAEKAWQQMKERRALINQQKAEKAQIAQYRATPYYGAIVYNLSKDRIAVSNGYNSEQKAIEKSTRHCKADCKFEVITTFSNACAVVVTPTDKLPKSKADFFVGIDTNAQKAASKAMNACVVKYGKSEDKCFYIDLSSKGEQMLCSGYEYGFYEK